MECNKDEALRAKEIAEGKFRAKEFEGAKKFALKASQLYPALDGVTQMLATFDVYLASEKKINGEMDWYEILCVNSTADDEMVKKQYRTLALILHPDKNKSVGAEGAFKLISEAWSVLSDKLRRSAYDHKRNFKGCAQKATPANRPAAPPRAGTAARGTYGYNFASSNAGSNSKTHKAAQAPPPVQRQSKPSTFWTSCSRCRMQYEYLRIYVNHNLLCPNCHEPFLAIEMGTVPSASGTFPWTVPQQNGHPNQSMYGKHFHASQNSTLQCGQHSQTSNVSTSNAASYPSYEKIRREEARYNTEEFKKTSSGLHSGSSNVCPGGSEIHVPTKKQRSMVGHGVRADDDQNMGTGDSIRSDVCRDAYETERLNGVSRGMPCKQYGPSMKDLAMQDIRTMLILKVRQDIKKKLEEWNSGDAEKAKEKRKAPSSMKENGTSNGNGDAHDESKSDAPLNQRKKQKPSSNEDGVGDEDEETDGPSSIHVIDPDFYDFDNDRSEKSFEANQVWAAYDDDDGMPRFYAFVQKVVSVKPFKMRISWLHSKSNSEVGPINWVASGFTKTSGEFRVSRYAIYDNVNVFSHKVRWDKGLRGVIRIFPRKGDIWAIYRNWSKDWDESTPDEVRHKYDMVEVLDDLVEDQGISIALLVKVPGFKTVFQRIMDSDKAQTIPREELFRFSHKVPSRLLTGEEAEIAPKGCLELDPAATPLELLQVITEAKNDEIGASQETGEQ